MLKIGTKVNLTGGNYPGHDGYVTGFVGLKGNTVHADVYNPDLETIVVNVVFGRKRSGVITEVRSGDWVVAE